MSRIGNSPISIPEGVTVTVENAVIKVTGPKGELEQGYDSAITIDISDNVVTLTRPSEEKDHRSKHGLYRSLINNMVEGVTQGYVKELELYGVGFRAQSQGQQLTLNLGHNQTQS
jgi:large subunit ribosomal protein L6